MDDVGRMVLFNVYVYCFIPSVPRQHISNDQHSPTHGVMSLMLRNSVMYLPFFDLFIFYIYFLCYRLFD